jgi:uncharacterized protein with ATP-grasp and redox domains
MKTHTTCASCFIHDLEGALATTVPDPALRIDILRQAMAWLGEEFDCQHIPSYYITRVHRLLKQRAGLEMPFRELREQCNRAGLAVRRRVARQLSGIEHDYDRLRTLVLWAIAGNHLDFRTIGTGYGLSVKHLYAQLAQIVDEGLAINAAPQLLAFAQLRSRVLYLADNVGEIALDTLLVKELLRHGCQVTVAVKGGPITSDAVLEDAQAVGMDKLVPLIVTGPDTLGLPLDEMSDAVRDELQRADLVLSKGQANYYACSELVGTVPPRILCLLRTKCLVAARSLGLDQPRANVAVLLGQDGSD